MPLIPVSDLQDARLEPFRHLKRTNQTRWQEIFIAEGEKLVERMLDSHTEIVSILAADTYVERIVSRVPCEIPIYVIPAGDVDELIGFEFHRGVLACGRRPENPPLHSLWANRVDPITLVLCPEIRDPENLGSMLRISAAFGVHGVILGADCTDPFSRRVLRVSMGTLFRLPLVRTTDWGETLGALRSAGFEVAATILDPAAESLAQATRTDRLAVAFGSEGFGLPADFVSQCDRKLTIQMADGVDSLNVAVATGIFLHQLTQCATRAS